MRRYSAAQARQRISELLDAAEGGEAVIIERRGTRFKLVVSQPERRSRRPNLIGELDPALEAGQFTWEQARAGLRFRRRRGAR